MNLSSLLVQSKLVRSFAPPDSIQVVECKLTVFLFVLAECGAAKLQLFPPR